MEEVNGGSEWMNEVNGGSEWINEVNDHPNTHPALRSE